jgi:hypothetical protein
MIEAGSAEGGSETHNEQAQDQLAAQIEEVGKLQCRCIERILLS